MEKSRGQTALAAWADWIGSWVALSDVPSGQRIVLALWAMHTWFAPAWPVTAYLHVTSSGPGQGKTTLLKVLQSLTCGAGGRRTPTMRPLSVARDIDANANAVTYFFDQVEALNEAEKVSEGLALLLDGYAFGGTHRVTVGRVQEAYSTYCAKAFASIGDLHRDLRSRVIVCRLAFGQPARDWSAEVMTRGDEAQGLVTMFQDATKGKIAPWTMPEWLPGREREIWTPIISTAKVLDLDAATWRVIRRASEDFSEFKRTAAPMPYRASAVMTDDADADRVYAERALRDLAAVLPVASQTQTGNIHSAVAVERMKAIDGPWRVFRGKGLDVDTLAGLLARFNLWDREKGVDVVRMTRGRASKPLRGYMGSKVRAAVKVLDAPQIQADADGID